MQKGHINVTTENIFPIIKKFLYSDHDIFLREIVSNAVDATQKLKTLSSVGEYKGELGDLAVRVSLDEKNKTITVSDMGIGMTEEEIGKYINEIAFSSAEEFLDRYKDKAQAIIGHFGLGFYSAFMVSKKVEIITKSFKEGAEAIKWSCDGNPEFTIEKADKAERGTDIIMHIDDESAEFMDEAKIADLLKKYCRFLPVPIIFGKQKEWKDGEMVETEKDNQVNETSPLWTKNPSDLNDEDYKSFYSSLYPMQEESLFHIHLFVDYPFKLTGILYFPKIKNNIELQKNKIQLFCNQVFVTDSVEGIVPDFLTLLHGVIDSPDIPLNISRSYLQSDSNVKKISSHISKKVADKLQDIFKANREEFEKKWDALKIFIEYGMLTDEKFYERAEKFVLLKNTESKYFTLQEYQDIIKENQTDKDKQLIYLYSTNPTDQHSFIETAKAKGYDVLLMDGHLDAHFINHLESKLKDSRFVRVDAEVVDKLIKKEDHKGSSLSNEEQEQLRVVFNSVMPSSKGHFFTSFEDMGDAVMPVTLTQSEFMRRMKDMSALGGGMSFYGEMPDSFNMVVNAEHKIVKSIIEDKNKNTAEAISPLLAEEEQIKKELDVLAKEKEGKKEEEVPQEIKDKTEEANKKLSQLEEKKKGILTDYAKSNPLVKQIIDIALLANNLLKGEELTRFVKRSIDMLG